MPTTAQARRACKMCGRKKNIEGFSQHHGYRCWTCIACMAPILAAKQKAVRARRLAEPARPRHNVPPTFAEIWGVEAVVVEEDDRGRMVNRKKRVGGQAEAVRAERLAQMRSQGSPSATPREHVVYRDPALNRLPRRPWG
jgi:hypothetical protein